MQLIDLVVQAGPRMPRDVHYTMFAKLIARLEKEKVKQVLICFAQNAPRLAGYLDYEVANGN